MAYASTPDEHSWSIIFERIVGYAPGMRESVEIFQKEIKGTSSSEVMNMIMYSDRV
jgi:hypothetical protein